MKAKKNHFAEQEPVKHHLKSSAPFIFSIPRPYQDDLMDRDKDMYVKVQKIQQSYESLKQELEEFIEKYEKQHQQTKNTIAYSLAIINRYINRKQNGDDEFYG